MKYLKGELYLDDAVLQSSADDDMSCTRSQSPCSGPAMRRTSRSSWQFANRQGLKVAMRGQGHSFFGQTQVEGGVVIDRFSPAATWNSPV